MAVTFLVSKCAYLNSQRLYRSISRTFSQVTFGAFMTLESRKKSSPQCVLGIFGINQGPNFHKPDTYSTWAAHPSRLLGYAVPCRPLESFAESSWDLNCRLHIVSIKLWMNILDYHIPLGLNLEGDTHIYCNQIYSYTLLSTLSDVSICCYPKLSIELPWHLSHR